MPSHSPAALERSHHYHEFSTLAPLCRTIFHKLEYLRAPFTDKGRYPERGRSCVTSL